MNAIEELPDKDKDLILPIFPLKGWVGAHKLEKATERIKKAIGDRVWIANIDNSYLYDNKEYLLTGKYPREVFGELEALLDAKDGHNAWYEYLVELPNAIPVIQWGNSLELEPQIKKLLTLQRGIVVIITPATVQNQIQKALETLSLLKAKNVFVIFDFGQITAGDLNKTSNIVSLIQHTQKQIQDCYFSISSSSFPSSFSGYNKGENPIYERQLFRNVSHLCPEAKMIYSDRGSARATKLSGGGGIPSPRIDYPLKNDWRFIRKEFDDSENPRDSEKEELYTEIAKDIINAEYWNSALRLWGTQIIELTSKRDRLGINSPAKATAVRINIHLHLQLHYDIDIAGIDTDEDWDD
jgi:hypothetical protein